MVDKLIEEVVPAETVMPLRNLEVQTKTGKWYPLLKVEHESYHLSVFSRTEIDTHAFNAGHFVRPKQVTLYLDGYERLVRTGSDEIRIRRRMDFIDENKVAEFLHPAAQELEVGEEL